MARKSLGSEPYCHRAIGILLYVFVGAIGAGELLIGLQHGAGLVVMDHERPELLGRDRRWERDLVGLAAVKVFALAVAGSVRVGRSGARLRIGHRLRDAGCLVMVQCAGIQEPFAVV